MLSLTELIQVTIHFKEKAFLLVVGKVWADVVTAGGIDEFITIEKVTTTGLLIGAVWYLMNEKKRIEKKYSQILSDREKKHDEEIKEKDRKIEEFTNKLIQK